MPKQLNTPLVSVIIPVHNRAEQLPLAVDSVISQALNVEIILIDDASTDRSPEVIRELATDIPAIVYCLLEQNRGGGCARNVGINMARGRWIAFLDSDDIWLPGKLQAQLSLLEANHDQEALCFTNLLIDRHDGMSATVWNTHPFYFEKGVKDFLLAHGQVIQTSTILMSATAAKKVKFNETLRRHQDIDFVIRCANAGIRFVYINETLVLYSADQKASRVSKRVNAVPSLKWLEVAKDYLSVQELDKFYMQHIFDMHFKDAIFSAVSRGLLAVKNQSLSLTDFSRCLARQLVPQCIKKLRNAIRER